jgi:hypothetical protein
LEAPNFFPHKNCELRFSNLTLFAPSAAAPLPSVIPHPGQELLTLHEFLSPAGVGIVLLSLFCRDSLSIAAELSLNGAADAAPRLFRCEERSAVVNRIPPRVRSLENEAIVLEAEYSRLTALVGRSSSVGLSASSVGAFAQQTHLPWRVGDVASLRFALRFILRGQAGLADVSQHSGAESPKMLRSTASTSASPASRSIRRCGSGEGRGTLRRGRRPLHCSYFNSCDEASARLTDLVEECATLSRAVVNAQIEVRTSTRTTSIVV